MFNLIIFISFVGCSAAFLEIQRRLTTRDVQFGFSFWAWNYVAGFKLKFNCAYLRAVHYLG